MANENEDSRRYVVAGVGGLIAAVLLTTAYTMVTKPEPRPAPSAEAQSPMLAPEPSRPVLAQMPSPGQPVPDFTLPRLGGGTVTLSQLRGKVVVIDFWATWCPPCRAEMPWLVPMALRLEPKGVVFVAISEDDPPGQVPLVNQFAAQVPGLERFAVLGDPEVEARYGVDSLPSLFIVDRQGRLVTSAVGAASEQQVVSFIEKLAEQ